MANIFKPKRSSTASSVPTTSDLADGEIAVNSSDKKIYLRDGQSVVEVANANIVDDTTPQLGGTLDTNGNLIQFGDSSSATDNRLQFGASQDLQIFHDGGHSTILDNGTGVLRLLGSQIEINKVDNSEHMAKFIPDSAVELYYNGSKKFETTSDGVQITGRNFSTGDYAYFSTSSSSNASLTIKKSAAGADAIDYLQLRDSNNALKLKLGGDGVIYSPDVLASHEGDTDTRLRFPGNDIFAIETGGGERFRANSSGVTVTDALRVTDSSTYTVDVGANGQDGALISTLGSSASLALGTDSTERLRIQSNGQILFSGTSGDNQFTSRRTNSTSSSGDYFFQLNAQNNSSTTVGSLGFHRDTATDDSRFVISTRNTGGSNTERLRIGPLGQLGFGGANYGTSGQVLTSNGSSSAPTWQNAGAGTDAGTLDGLDSSQFLRSDAADTATGTITISGLGNSLIAQHDVTSGNWSGRIISKNATLDCAAFLASYNGFPGLYAHNNALNAWHDVFINSHGTGDGQASVYLGTSYINGNIAWHAGNDGSGSGLDADTVDGIQASSFLRSDASDTTTGMLTISRNGAQLALDRPDGSGQDWRFYQWGSGLNIYPSAAASDVFFGRDGYTTHVDLWNGGLKVAGTTVLNNSRQLSSVTYGGNTIWHAGNDGSGSGLDADLWDGNQFGSYLNQSVKTNAQPLFGTGTSASYIRIGDSVTDNNNGSWNKGVHLNATNHGRFRIRTTDHTYGALETYYWADSTVSPSMGIYGNSSTFKFTGSITTLQNKDGNTFWHAGNDGSGSSLDADLLDGQQGSYYRQAWQNVDSGVRTNYTLGFQPPSSGYAGFYFSKSTTASTASDAGYLLIRGTSDNDVYTAEGITLVADAGWLTLAQRTTSSRGVRIMSGTTSAERLKVNTDGTIQFVNGAGFTYNGNTIWHAGNDGSGSTLDADKLDSQEGSYYLNYNNFTNTPTIPTNNNQLTNGAGYITSFDITTQTDSKYLRSDAADISTGATLEIRGGTAANEAQIKIDASNAGSPQIGFGDERDNTGDNYWAIGADDTDVSYFKFATRNSTGIPVVNGNTSSEVKFTIEYDGNLWAGPQDVNKIWHAGNDGSGSGLDADTLDGLQVHTGTNNEVNKVVRTNSSGYLMTGWINTTSGSRPRTTAPSRIYASDDGYIRYYSLSDFKVALGLPNSTFNRSISYSTTTGYHTGVMGHSNNYNANTTLCHLGSGFIDFWNSTSNAPDTGHWVGMQSWHAVNWQGVADNNYGWQIVNKGGSSGNLKMQAHWASTNYGWQTIWNSANDGSGSGLDADTVDGIDSGSFLRSDANDVLGGVISYHSDTARLQFRNTSYNTYLYIGGWTTSNDNNISRIRNSSGNLHIDSAANGNLYLNHYSSGTIYARGSTVWHAGNDGSGSGLDADTVDGIQASSFLRSDADDTLTGNLQINSHVINMDLNNINDNAIELREIRDSTWPFQFVSNDVGNDNHSGFWVGSNGYPDMRLRRDDGTVRALISSWETSYVSNGFNINGSTAWHAGNDGSGSGLDADNLDGYTWTSSGKNVRATEFYADNWFRNYNAGEGLYNEATGCHFVSDGTDQWTIRDSGNSIRIEFKTNGSSRRASVYADNGPSIGFLNSANQWGLRYLSNDGNSPNLYWKEEANETWTGDPGNDEGKIEYHSNRFYIAAGANSTYVCQFRRSGTDVARVENDGKIYAQGSNLVWHAGNDGSGSGLDADTVDGAQAANLLGTHQTNNLNIVNKGYYTTATSGQNQNSGTISYGWGYQINGGWSHPYPDIVFGYHTGMRFGGHTSYGGCRFYADHPSRTSTILFSVGNGNSNVHVTNDLTAGGNVTAYSSDRRLKENFKNIESPLEKLSKLNGCSFDWIENIEDLGFTPDFAKNDIGLIAQEVEAVCPQAVAPAPFDHECDIYAEDPEDRVYKSKSGENYLTVKYEKLVPLLVEAIKEQQKQIDEQQEMIDRQQDDINNLKQQIKDL